MKLSNPFYNAMRTLFFIFVFIAVHSENLLAQMVYIPDANFRAKLVSSGFSSCISGDSINSGCSAVMNRTSLDVSTSNISNLQGIQAFSSLTTLQCYNNQLSSLPSLPNTLTTLDCYYNQLASLPALPVSIIWLRCDKNLLTVLPSLPNSLTQISCSQNLLTALPALPSNLTSLNCSQNLLTSLPALPNSLLEIYCARNQLASIPALPASITRLDCFNNHLTNLPVLPATFTSLNCDSNQLTSLPALPLAITGISCSYNQITTLPSLPNSLLYFSLTHNSLVTLPALSNQLRNLRCDYNLLSVLPALPVTLNVLECTHNLLPVLPTLPNSLIDFYCDNNQLSALPALPIALTNLNCGHNSLSGLPVLPDSLLMLHCDNNMLTSLPALPKTLMDLSCINNLLTYLPELPDTMSFLICYNNPNLHCLPRLKKISWLDFLGNPITCLPNYGEVDGSLPTLSSLPLCGIFNPNGCDVYWNISGRNYVDANANCSYEAGDAGQANTHIQLYKNGTLNQQVFAGAGGLYTFDITGTGNYQVQIDTANLPFDVSCPANRIYNDTLTPIDTLFYDNDFSLRCKNGFDLGIWNITGWGFRPAHQTTLYIHAGDIANFYGAHCANGIGGTVTVVLNGPVTYIGPAPGALTPTYVSGDSLVYSIPDFGTVNLMTAFNPIVRTDTLAANGTPVCVSVSVTVLPGDNNTSNNTLTNCFTVHTSYDPNEKEVSPAGYVTGTGWLTYTIHFQNTGNAAAENIYILDTLDSDLDLSTFQLLFSSHPAMVQILEGGIARFNFPLINLPDSNSNEPLSHGSVQYKLKLKTTTPPSSQITNTANIYFDFNPPVVTNTTQNTLCQTSLSNIHASICPGDSFSFNGQTLTQAGIYTDSSTNGNGCDSIITLTLQVFPPGTSTLNQTICANDSFNFNGTILTQAGTFLDTVVNSNGCDSVITLQLSVSTVDTSVLQSTDSLTALTPAATYQWMNCTTGSLVPGANNQVFRPSFNGSYALVITENNCTDTSSCYSVIVTAVTETEASDIRIYPNPFGSELTVYYPSYSSVENISIKIYTVLGMEVSSTRLQNKFNILSTADFARGVYFLRVQTPSGIFVRKLVKQ